jgi:hypothetical protein
MRRKRLSGAIQERIEPLNPWLSAAKVSLDRYKYDAFAARLTGDLVCEAAQLRAVSRAEANAVRGR